MDLGLIHTIWTILLLGVFIGIIAWAWSSKRQKDFERAARMALEEPEEKHHE